jgi:hypothetical protein
MSCDKSAPSLRWAPARGGVHHIASCDVARAELRAVQGDPWALISSLGASSMWSIPMRSWIGPAGDSKVPATTGKSVLALLRFRLVAFPVILSTPYGKISATLPSLLLSKALYCTLDSPPLPAPTPVIRIEAGRLLNPAPPGVLMRHQRHLGSRDPQYYAFSSSDILNPLDH